MMNKALEAALRAMSYTQLEVKTFYKLQRTFGKVGGITLFRDRCQSGDFNVICRQGKVPVRVFYPEGKDAINDIILFFHGGGWVTGDVDSYNHVCAVAARHTKRKVISVDYRLAPEHPFPKGLTDCYEVAKFLFENCYRLFGVNSDRITLMGDSAGGNLAAAVSLKARDEETFVPKRQILIYPATNSDHSEKSPYKSVKENGTDYILTKERICDYMALYKTDDADLKNPYFAPLLASDFSRQPDTLIVSAEFCPLRDEGEEFGNKLRDAGNRVEIFRMMNAIHGFFSLPSGFSQVKKCYEVINHFLREETTDAIQKEHAVDAAGQCSKNLPADM